MVMSKTVPIKTETLTRFADNARRLGNVNTELSTDEMIRIFSRATTGVISGGLFATLTPNQAIVPEIVNYVNDITMEGGIV